MNVVRERPGCSMLLVSIALVCKMMWYIKPKEPNSHTPTYLNSSEDTTC